MLNFNLIEKSQINDFKSYYNLNNALGCDANMLNAYLWRNEYNIKFTVTDDTLIKIYSRADDSIWGYCMPTGRNIDKAVDKIIEDALQRNSNPRFVMLTNEQKFMLEKLRPDEFNYSRSPENQDYIYYSEELATLAGKKFHAKRNHISKFYKSYDDNHYETLDSSNSDDAMSVMKQWCKENCINPNDCEEVRVFADALEMREEYNMHGAVLYVESKPVAMTLGSEINNNVFDVQFEKALREYNGAYAVINNSFVKTLTRYKYINREEDMGIEGLRKSKLSYKPCIILDRFNAEHI